MDDKKILPLSTLPEEVLGAVIAVASKAPWFSEPLCPILIKMSIPHNFERVRAVLVEIADQIKDIEEEDAQRYLKTDQFKELFERTLQDSAGEPDEHKRTSYANFLANDLKLPWQPYAEKVSLLHTLEELPPDGIRLLKALLHEPDAGEYAPIYQTLQQRLPDLSIERIGELAGLLEQMGIANFKSQTALLRGRRPGDLQVLIGRSGQRLLAYILPGG